MADPAGQAGDVMQAGNVRFRSIETLGELVGRYCWVEHRIFEMTGAWASESDGRDSVGSDPRRREPSGTFDADSHNADSHNADSHNADSHNADSHNADSHNADSHNADSHGLDSHDAVDAERRVWCAAVSRRHGELSARWQKRLPVRAGVERAALVASPAGRVPALLDELASTPDPWDGLAGLVRVVLPGLSQTYGAHLRCASAVSESPVMEVLVEARREGQRDIRGGLALLERVPRMAKGAGYGAPTSADDSAQIFERAFDQFGIFPAVRQS